MNCLLVLLNLLRAMNGQPTLAADQHLTEVATIRAQQAATNFSHYAPDGSLIVRGMVPTADWVGETLVMAHNVQEAETALEHSPPHRAILLDARFQRAGTGSYTSNGWMFYAEVLTN